MRRLVIGACVFVLAGSGSLRASGFDDKAVENAINRGIEFLWQSQKPDGSWGVYENPTSNNYHYSGPTALAAYALLECGVNPQEPRMAKALGYLADYTKEDGTYSLGLRCNVWEVANRQTPGKYDKLLYTDARKLWLSTGAGHYTYKCQGKAQDGWDNSNSQYGLLGVWAAAMGNVEVPRGYWPTVMKHWEKHQNPDGGWGYHQDQTRGTMVAAGVASLFVCYDEVFADRFATCAGTTDYYRRVKKGLDWFDKNFTGSLGGDIFYYLYGVERVGLASGYKYFGKTDWYKEGATRLLHSQGANGAWTGGWGGNPAIATGFALLFLARGRNAVIFNKLEYEGDWNNRPRDLANLTHWMSRIFERTVNWQIVNLQVPVTEWHDAPILYIAGSRTPKFSDQDVQKIRTFILQGGAVFSVSECGGAGGFRKSIRDLHEKLFPQYKLALCEKDHPIYTRKVHFDLPGRPQFYIVSNGVRPLIVHTDADVPLSWQARRAVTQKWAFEAAANVVRYITDRVSMVRPRGTTHWPAPAGGNLTRTVKLARLKYAGDYDPEPLAYERFGRLMAQGANTKLEVLGPMDIKDLAGSGAQVATITGAGKLELTSAEQSALKEYVDKGGTLAVDAAGGSKTFGDSAEGTLQAIFGEFKLRPLASSADLFRMKGMEIDKVKYRRLTRTRLARQTAPNVKGVLFGNRVGVIFSREDITAGLVGYPSFTVDGYEPESAYEIMRNIVLSAK